MQVRNLSPWTIPEYAIKESMEMLFVISLFFIITFTSLQYENIIIHSLRYDHYGSVVDPLSPPLDHVHEFDQRVGGCGHPVAQRPASELKQLDGPRWCFYTGHEFGERYDLQTYRTMII